MEDAIEVDEAGLQSLAEQHETAAVALAHAISPPLAGSPLQATIAAVSHGHIVVDATAERLAARITATGARLRTAATFYACADIGSAEQIAVAGRSLGG